MAEIKDPENTLILETSKGRVVIEMRPDLAPGHVTRIKELARKGFYDGLKFHRVIDGFMAQTRLPGGHRHGRLGQEAQGGVLRREAHARHRLHGARAEPEFRRQPVLHLLRRGALAEQAIHRLGPGDRRHGNVDAIQKGEPPKSPDTIVSMRVAADAA